MSREKLVGTKPFRAIDDTIESKRRKSGILRVGEAATAKHVLYLPYAQCVISDSAGKSKSVSVDRSVFKENIESALKMEKKGINELYGGFQVIMELFSGPVEGREEKLEPNDTVLYPTITIEQAFGAYNSVQETLLPEIERVSERNYEMNIRKYNTHLESGIESGIWRAYYKGRMGRAERRYHKTMAKANEMIRERLMPKGFSYIPAGPDIYAASVLVKYSRGKNGRWVLFDRFGHKKWEGEKPSQWISQALNGYLEGSLKLAEDEWRELVKDSGSRSGDFLVELEETRARLEDIYGRRKDFQRIVELNASASLIYHEIGNYRRAGAGKEELGREAESHRKTRRGLELHSHV